LRHKPVELEPAITVSIRFCYLFDRSASCRAQNERNPESLACTGGIEFGILTEYRLNTNWRDEDRGGVGDTKDSGLIELVKKLKKRLSSQKK